LFSEGQVYVIGTGTLNVTSNCKHGFACDDYIVINDGVTLNVSSTTGNGIKVNDGLWINNGTLDISVTADAARGIKCDNVVVITGGITTIATSGNCVYDNDAAEYSSAACIKCDDDFTMSGGTLTMTSSGDGGKGINSSTKVFFSGGISAGLGVEYAWNGQLFARAGYHYGGDGPVPSFASAGLGIRLADFSLNGAYIFGSDVLANTFALSFGVSF
jgi:hypothetical protein